MKKSQRTGEALPSWNSTRAGAGRAGGPARV